jgi:hypothetical protein
VLIAGSSLADYTGVACGLTFAGFALMMVLIVALAGATQDAASLLEP